jgi:hypothetical protein
VKHLLRGRELRVVEPGLGRRWRVVTSKSEKLSSINTCSRISHVALLRHPVLIGCFDAAKSSGANILDVDFGWNPVTP